MKLLIMIKLMWYIKIHILEHRYYKKGEYSSIKVV